MTAVHQLMSCETKSCVFVINVLMVELFNMLIDGLESCGLLIDYCDVFISCFDSDFDGTHHCRGSICEQVM